MRNFTITFGHWVGAEPLNDVAECGLCYVKFNNDQYPLKIEISGSLYSCLPNQYHSSNFKLLHLTLLKIVLPRFILKLNNIEPPAGKSNKFLLAESFNSNDKPLFLNEALAKRKCIYQKTSSKGLLCDVTANNDSFRGRTSKIICENCNLPDDRLRCSLLQHPEIIGTSPQANTRSRVVYRALCDIKTEEFDASNCFPGGYPCWVYKVSHNISFDTAVLYDIEKKVIDELTHFNLMFLHKFGNRILRVNDLRTSVSIISKCTSEQEFPHHVASIANVLNDFNLTNGNLSIDANTKGSINRLEELFQNMKYLTNNQPIKTLRAIINLRNSFPIHSSSDKFVSAWKELGLQYPIDNWDTAWKTILYQLWTSIRDLRLMLN